MHLTILWFDFDISASHCLPFLLLLPHLIPVWRHVRADVDFQFLFCARSLLIIIPLVDASRRGAAFSRCIFSDFFFHSLRDFKLAKCLTEIEESHAISRCPWKLSVFDWLPGAKWSEGTEMERFSWLPAGWCGVCVTLSSTDQCFI